MLAEKPTIIFGFKTPIEEINIGLWLLFIESPLNFLGECKRFTIRKISGQAIRLSAGTFKHTWLSVLEGNQNTR